MPEFGFSQGLSRSGQYDQKIQDLRYNEIADERAKQEAIARSKMNAEDSKYKNAMNPYDHEIVKKYSLGVIDEIGRLKQQNPDWQWNDAVRTQISNKLEDLKTNKYLIKGLAFDNQETELIKDMQEAQKNPTYWDVKDLQDQYKKFQTYKQTGHYLGEEGLKKDGQSIAPVYIRPRAFVDLNELERKTGDSLNPNAMENINNGRDGAFRTYVRDEDLIRVATGLYNSNKRQYDTEYTEKGLDPIKGIANRLPSYIKTDMKIGDRNNLQDQMALEKYKSRLKMAEKAQEAGQNVSPYKEVILKSDNVKTDPEDLAGTFGTKVPYFYHDASGKLVKGQGDDFYYDGNIYDKNYRKDGNYKKTGVKVTPGYFIKPLSWGEEQGYLLDNWGWGKDDKVRPEFKDQVEVLDTKPDKDGKSNKVLKIKAFNEVNSNSPEYEGKFNKNITTNKQKEGIGISENLMREPVTATRQDFINAGYSESQIQRGVNEGLIKLR